MSQRATRFVDSALPRSPIHGVFEIRDVLPQPFTGDLVGTLERTVQSAEEGNRKLRILPEPDPPLKLDSRPWLRLIQISDQPKRCHTSDCFRDARLLLESRDQEVLPHCTACALVEFALWMAGV
jgi:hypothetical protein